MSHKILEFPHFIDAKGTLTPFELNSNFPFEVKRVYTVTGVPGVTRGAHAHILESEVFVAISGRVEATLDNGETCERVVLDHPSKALYVKTMCWHEFDNFSEDAVLLCFSSTPYLPGNQNYICDRQEFYDRLKLD